MPSCPKSLEARPPPSWRSASNRWPVSIRISARAAASSGMRSTTCRVRGGQVYRSLHRDAATANRHLDAGSEPRECEASLHQSFGGGTLPFTKHGEDEVLG